MLGLIEAALRLEQSKKSVLGKWVITDSFGS